MCAIKPCTTANCPRPIHCLLKVPFAWISLVVLTRECHQRFPGKKRLRHDWSLRNVPNSNVSFNNLFPLYVSKYGYPRTSLGTSLVGNTQLVVCGGGHRCLAAGVDFSRGFPSVCLSSTLIWQSLFSFYQESTSPRKQCPDTEHSKEQ